MPYTVEDRGLINNFANEPKVYQAEPPSQSQKRNFAFLGVGAIALVSALVYVAISVS